MKVLLQRSLIIFIFLASCQRQNSVCPAGSVTYFPSIDALLASTQPALDSQNNSQVPVEINGRTLLVDQIVSGPLCKGFWRGTVYVACDVAVLEWEESSTFLKDCDLVIEPDAVVYVAAHNNAPHYKGCSCHTGELAEDY